MCFLRENKKGNQPFLFLMSSNSLMIPNIINPPPDNTSTTLNIFFHSLKPPLLLYFFRDNVYTLS